ncbi:MAG TPA: omptin family outer membrane protease, partial [Geobacteraceae bacterium]
MYLLFAAPGIGTPLFAAEEKATVPLTKQLSLALKTKRLFSSHTSYEFGNPFPPNQVPLSRLQFPLDSWWGGAEIRGRLSRFSLGVEAFRNISGEADGRMRDSDWDDDTNPILRTIYSESQCRMEPSYMVRADADVEVADLLGAPRWFSLRPVVGFRWQDFNLVTHDGVQYCLPGPSVLPLPCDGLRFSQTYWQYFIGLRSCIDAGELVHITGLNLLLQADWAYVEANNKDHHLLRTGSRFTYEDTYGQAWHASIQLEKSLYKALYLNV